MKIGILTFHRSYNYGAFMQCWSLSSRLRMQFPSAEFEVVDYTSAKAFDGYRKELEKYSDPELRQAVSDRNDCFIACQQQLPLSQPQLIGDDIKEAADYLNERYDAVIVGSDAVWNWNSRGFPNVYFLKDYHGKKFSYAASAHGLNYQDATEDQKAYLREAFSDFCYIGVRDTTTEAMVKSVFPEAAVFHNCDPTVLLDIDTIPCDMDALKQKLIARGIDFTKPLIGLMAGPSIGEAVKRHFGDRVQLVAVYAPNKYADVYLNDLTPFEWARVFSLFELTFTHYFHGTLLSLRNGTPVLPVETVNAFSAKNVTKIEDVMARLGLSEWRNVIDHRSCSRLTLAARRLLHCEDRAVWKRVLACADELMQTDCKQRIEASLAQEAAGFDTFAAALSKYIQE